MWPSISDMSRDECRKCLRCLELDAYGNMVSVLRAQGPLTEEKRKLLGELAKFLHISNERHRAEIRRAVNDEKLSIIAEQLNGPNTCTDWAIEGRRTIPLLPRLKAHTAFTGLANSLSLVLAAANEKKLAASTRVEDLIVKTEPASPEDCERDELPMTNIAATPAETKTRGRKRKRSTPGSSDNDKCRKAQSTETKTRHTEANSQVDHRVASPRRVGENEMTNVVQVSIVTPSSTVDTTSPNNVNTPEASSTKLSNHHKFIVEASINRNCEEDDTIANTLILDANDRQNIGSDINGQQTFIEAQCGVAKTLEYEERGSRVTEETLVEAATQDETKISRPDSTTSGTPCTKRLLATKFCVTTKPIITSSTNCMMTVNSGSTASCGPGPPSVTPSATLTYKKLSMGKLNHHSGTQTGTALNSSKTLKINAHPNARMANKANVIVVKKGSSRGVTLSHGGKEVLGKVIMGGKSLYLGSQKSNASVATLLPHRGGSSNNGEQTLTTLTLSQAESLKSLGSKTGNMIMLDIRQDVLDENTVLSQFFEASRGANPEAAGTTGLKNSSNRPESNNHAYVSAQAHVTKSPETIAVNGMTVELSENHETLNEDCSSFYSIVGNVDSSDVNDNREVLETIEADDIETHVLDPQTGLYNYESADGIVIEDPIEQSIQTTGIDFFTNVLDSPDINLESLRYVDDDDDVEDDRKILNETSDHTLEDSPFCEIVERVDQLSDS